MYGCVRDIMSYFSTSINFECLADVVLYWLLPFEQLLFLLE